MVKYFYELLIIHTLVIGMVVTSGYISNGIIIVAFLHLGAFIVYLILFYLLGK